MRWFVLSLICVAVTGVAATAATARTDTRHVLSETTGPTAPLATALQDPVFQGPQETTALTMARHAGATYAKVIAVWKDIAPASLPKSGFVPTDPKSPYYHWSGLDATISAANAVGITPVIEIFTTPSWAYQVKPGTWTGGSPNVTMLGQFATALAKHYNGSHPAAHIFSVWNEPNLNRNLYPQSETYYRSMVNAVATSVHAVDASDLVVAGELAPFKHAQSATDKNNVIPPITFMQQMLCISAGTPAHRTCNTPAKFDVWAHHPYSDTGPYGKATASGGVELGDLPKMDALLQTAEKLGAISSAKPVQFWVTEFGWSSKPPNTHGVPSALLTRWLAESMYQIWKSGATMGMWYLLQDQPSSTPFQSGLYSYSASLSLASAKTLLIPFRFPFVAYLKSGGKVQVWGRDTTSNAQTVTIQEKIGKKAWKTVATITTNSYGIFQALLPLHALSAYSLQAVAPGSGTSATFSLTVPSNENMKVTPFPAGGSRVRP